MKNQGRSLLSLDPSSKCLGWAFGEPGSEGLGIKCAGRIAPPEKKKPLVRIEMIVDGLWSLLSSIRPAHVLIEIPGGRQQKKVGQGIGLTVYGMAVGAVWNTCYLSPEASTIHPIRESDWIGNKKKSERPFRAKLFWPGYERHAEEDKGRDIADAICMMHWWVTMQVWGAASGSAS